MANSYIAVPNVLPGNVTVGGDLDVKGEVRVGPFLTRLRMASVTANLGMFSWNLQKDISTRDDATKVAYSFDFGNAPNVPRLDRMNTAGQLPTEALLSTLFTDFTNHVHTGTTTLDTQYTKLIRANLLGINGAIRVTLGYIPTVQGATPTTITLVIAVTTLATFTIPAGDVNKPALIELLWYSTNSAGAQFAKAWQLVNGNASVVATGNSAVLTTSDQTLTVKVQSGAVGDSQSFDFINITLLNTFGPVV